MARAGAGGPLVSDTFTRANSTTTLGSTDTGQAWTAQVGTWGISSNAAYVATGPGLNKATVETGLTACTVAVAISGATVTSRGLVLRWVDTNNYLTVYAEADSLRILRYLAGAGTDLSTVATTWADGDIISVVLSGSSITAKRNGVTITATTCSDFLTATKHGLWANNNIPRLDNFSVSA